MSATARRFEDLIAWQKARVLTKAVYQVTTTTEFARDFALRDQMRRAAVSVMSNLAEGFERNGPGEWRQFLKVAEASCAELRSQLYVALDVGYLGSGNFERLFGQADEIGRILGGLQAATERRQRYS